MAIAIDDVGGSLFAEPKSQAEDLLKEAFRADSGKFNYELKEGKNWYKQFPYEIEVRYFDDPEKQDKYQRFIYSLPIPPESLQTSMIPASSVTPTLDGVVEETSFNIFHQINLSGTTGIATNREDFGIVETSNVMDSTAPSEKFRGVIKNLGLVSGVAQKGEFVINTVKDLIKKDAYDILNSVAGTFPMQNYNAVNMKANGYTEIHLFHKFLHAYSLLKSKKPQNYKLYFNNVKDDHSFQVVLRNFLISKSKDSPFLYRYSIAFQGWDLNSMEGLGDYLETDRFEGDLGMIRTFSYTAVLNKTGKLIADALSGNLTNKLIDSVLGGGNV